MKIRTNYVSNSSSSSFIIECKNQEMANKLIEAYEKLYDYWMEICPRFNDDYIDRNNYHIVSVDEILDFFRDHDFNEQYIKEWELKLRDESKYGYVFLLGHSASDDGTIEHLITDYILNSVMYYLQNPDTNEAEIDVIFKTRWS